MSLMPICIVIPVHNEAQTIGDIVEGIRAKRLDVLVIDDGSRDGSGPIAQKRGAVVIRNNCKQGKGLSLQKGFAYALEQGYTGVITMDGDGQHTVEDLDVFLQEIDRDPQQIVNGTRMQNAQGMPLVRFLTNRFMSFLISRICRQSIPDTQCGYRYIGRGALERISLTCRDFEIETELLIKASKLGYRVSSVPIQTIYRNEESKINPFKDTIRFFAYLIREMRNP